MTTASPNTTTVLTHALSIQIGPGNPIGTVNEWSPSQQLTVTELFEFGGATGTFSNRGYGIPFEKVPGNVGGQTISARRYDLYRQLMENARVDISGGMDMLSKQLSSFTGVEVWRVPEDQAGNVGAGQYSYQYEGCWFSQMGKSYSTSGDRVSNVSASIEYTAKSRVIAA